MPSPPEDVVPAGRRLNSAYYAAPVDAFLRAADDEVYAPLASPHGYTLAPEQLSAWRLQLPYLRAALEELTAQAAPAPWIHLELDIPRLGRPVDAVLVTSTCVVPIEFKVGAKKFERSDYEQAWDYGLDLKNFHAPSHAAAIFPILCATGAPRGDVCRKSPQPDGVRPRVRVNINRVHWFLSPAYNTRSLLCLELAATEFQVQGLKNDWTIITRDADLRRLSPVLNHASESRWR